MQNKISKLQQDMAERTVESSAGGGMVKVVMNGRQEIRSLVHRSQGPGGRRRGNVAGFGAQRG